MHSTTTPFPPTGAPRWVAAARRLSSAAVAFLWPAMAWASETGHGAAGHAAQHGGGEGHWSLAVYLPEALRQKLADVLVGRAWYGHQEHPEVEPIVFGTISFLIVLALALAARKRLADPDRAIVPEAKLTPFTFFEMLVGTVFGIMEGIMGREKARETFPVIGSLATFILISNLMGLIPGFLPPTSNLSFNAAMALTVFALTHYYGIKHHGLSYLGHFVGPIRKWYALPLMLLMLPIEIISHLVRPLSLSLRLMGNMFGDHTVLGIFLGFGILLLPLPLQALGLLVAVVQTLVFCLLSIVYFAIALEEEH